MFKLLIAFPERLVHHSKKLIVLLYTFLSLASLAQDRIDSAMKILNEKYPQEKIYIAYNQSDYVAGEIIWFKGFVFSGYYLSDISTNLYVEVYNSNKNIVSKKIIPLFKGIAEGNLSMPDTISEGVYFIRAYTNWMLNFSEDFQYIHPIPIYNPGSKLKLKTTNQTWSASAFVEGGNLLDNKPSNIAVRLFSNGDLPQNWHGYLIDSLNPLEKIISFQSLDKNVAQFGLIPNKEKNYKLFIEDNNGQAKTISLPPVLSSGVNLSVNQQDSILEYKVDFNNMSSHETYKLVGTIDNNIVYRATIKNNDSTFIHSFSTAQMLKGVLRLTVFDNSYNVATERLCFLYPETKTKPIIDSLLLNNKPKAVNEFSLNVDSGKAYCAMVLDETANNPFVRNNIISSVWLSSDFSNNIQDAENYFSSTENKKALDALLITEKWERFNWQKILSNKFPVIKFPKDNYISYEATVYYKKNILPNEMINLILFMPDSSRQLVQAKTNAEGKFLLDGLLFDGIAKASYQLSNKKLNYESVKIEFSAQENYMKYEKALPVTGYFLAPNTETVISPKEQKKNEERIKSDTSFSTKFHKLKDVSVQTKTRTLTQLLDEKLSSGRFYNPREVIYDFINEKQDGSTGSNLHFWLRGRIPSFDPKDEKSGKISYYIDEFKVDRTMLFLIDGTSIDDVAMVKIQGRGDSHQVFIYLKRGGEMLYKAKPLNNGELRGYEHQETFRSPDYSNIDLTKLKTDSRELLYWSGIITSDSANEKSKIKFYNNDKAKKFRLVIIAVSTDEEPSYYEKILE